MKFTIRLTTPADAQGILEVYHNAVHVTAARDYPLAVLQLWSPAVDEHQIVMKTNRLERTLGRTVISYVAVAETGQIIGLGELVPPDTLGAVYVAASAGGKGVASALLRVLEAHAREIGMSELRMESSLTAVPFYALRGFRELGHDQHLLADGVFMACVRMQKTL